MSVYLALMGQNSGLVLGIYPSEREPIERHYNPCIKKKDVVGIDNDTGDITFSDGSKLLLTTRCVGTSWSGCSGETEIEWDYEEAK